MVERAKISKKRYLIAFVITLGIFLLGIFLGVILTETKLSKIDDLQLQFRTRLLSLELQSLLVGEDICNFQDVDLLVEELGELGETLNSMEDQLGKNDDRVLALKNYYSLLQIRHMLYIQDFNKKCDNKFTIVLFFYSNDESVCPDCQNQGYILSYLRAKYHYIRVYSYDIDLNSPVVRALLKLNSVEGAPYIVVDDNGYSGFRDKEFLEGIINEEEVS